MSDKESLGLELWARIKNFPYYLVSTHGRVYSRKTKRILQTKLNYDGYVKVRLSIDGRRVDCSVSRLVALAFLINPNRLPTVNHKDKDKTNNHVNNLAWASRSEQELHKNGHPCDVIDWAIKLRQEGKSLKEIREETKLSFSTIKRYCSQK